MQDKRKKVKNPERISRWCLYGMFLISVATAFVPIPEMARRIISVGTSCLFLLGNVMRYRTKFGKHHIGLWCFCVLCMLSVVACMIWSYVTLRICSIWAIYGYYLTGSVLMQGCIRRQSILFFLCSCCVITVSICLKHAAMTGLFLVLQILLLLRVANPALHMIATRHRDKRMEKGEERNPNNVNIMRKILFGQNGRFEIPGIERKRNGGLL